MRATAYGGFGEKGRTSIAVSTEGFTLLLDCGVNTSDSKTYYPALNPAECAGLDAMLISHAHEDHIAAVGWAVAHGFRGRLLMTRETRAEAPAIWKAYAPEPEYRHAMSLPVELIPAHGVFHLGPFRVETGRSGHIVGGVWVHLASAGRSVLYCGDVVPSSAVFPMDPLPVAGLVMLDGSYGEDDVSGEMRFASIRQYLGRNPACILPTPLIGRSLEMLALVEQPPALAPGMLEGLLRQLDQVDWLRPGIAAGLRDRLALTIEWQPDQPWPDRPLLCHDGMGLSGPSVQILERAGREGYPVLFTGHVPSGSPGDRLMQKGAAHWLRFPTHPTLSENRDIAFACRAGRVLAHSCAAGVLSAFARSIDNLVVDIRPRGSIEI
ncbi:MAG: MBL fold metallo-hydrolase [Rhizobiales bacterium]|nr:MBL fold metallo-hydrolase [Hyphomicrobiales bacterium]